LNTTSSLLVAILAPLLGAALSAWIRDASRARKVAVYSSAVCLAAGLAAWGAFVSSATDAPPAGSPGWPAAWLSLDQLSAPLLPLAALLWVFTSLVTPRGKLQRFSFTHALLLEALTMQGQRTLSCDPRNDFRQELDAPPARPPLHCQAMLAGMLLQK